MEPKNNIKQRARMTFLCQRKMITSELVYRIPAILSHFVTNLPAFHQVAVFLCIKSVPMPHVRPEERFLVGRVGPREYHIYRCIPRNGYRDVHKDDMEFGRDLVCSIAEFVRSEKPECGDGMEDMSDNERMTVVGTLSSNFEGIKLCEDYADADSSDMIGTSEPREIKSLRRLRKGMKFLVPEDPEVDLDVREELQELMEAWETGMAFILGHSYIRAKSGSGRMKRVVVNYGYDFLRRNSRAPS